MPLAFVTIFALLFFDGGWSSKAHLLPFDRPVVDSPVVVGDKMWSSLLVLVVAIFPIASALFSPVDFKIYG